MRGSPYAIQRSFHDCKDPGAGPQHDYGAGYDCAGADSGQRVDGLMQEFTGRWVDLQNVLDHFAAGGDPIAKCEQQEEGRE